MKKITGFIIFLLFFITELVTAQVINKVEYYIDTDPGFGNGTNVTISSSANIPDLLIPVNITSLSKGFHNIYVRSKDDAGKWSLTNRWLFVKDILSGNVNKLEYFIDTDPGFGNATDVSITPGSAVANIAIPVDVSALSKGFHNVYLRSKDDAGSWSITNRWLFMKDITSANVSKLEYFIDTDPGFGNGTDVSITQAGNVSDVLIPVDITSLSKGFHNLYLRSKGNTGTWSLTNRWLFFKDIAQDNLQSGEYFFDTDPGFGNGTAIPFGSGLGTNVSDFSFGAPLTGLPNGLHYLFVRTKEVNGKWSLTNVVQFDKNVPLPVKLIYFNATAEGKKAHLSWQTGTEQNSDRFDIERSTDGLHFEKIGWVKAAGNSTSHIVYNYFDQAPKKGINYYRLREVDIDNRFEFSETKTVHFGDDVLFALYNNPTNGSDLKLTVNILPSVLSVFDASGRKVKEVNVTTSSNSLSVAGLASATYLAVLNKDGKVIGVEKFVVNR
ncbi:MAG: T9SS type A sorting domain-containing protein [Chitinophagaceae bacterium]|nr:T9SS type A sorting domain-containing protein [Chitinophagaceae bacterium]